MKHNALSLTVERGKVAGRALQSIIMLSKIPIPPSCNNLFANKEGGGRTRSNRYRTWANAAGWEIRAQKPCRVRGPVEITLTFEDGGSRSDIDNLAKAPIDLLVQLQLIEGDTSAFVRRVVLQWGDVEGLHIRVEPSRNLPLLKVA